MIRTTMFRALIAVATGSMLVLTACGSDLKVSAPPVTRAAPTGSASSPGSTSGVSTSPSGGGAAPDCLKFAAAWASAIGSSVAGVETDANVFQALVDTVPDSLKADAKVLATAYTGYLNIIKKYNGDPAKAMADPEVQKALQALSTPDLNAAQDKITKYFDDQCPKG